MQHIQNFELRILIDDRFQRDGFMAINGNGGLAPNYPSPIKPNVYKAVDVNQEHENWVGKAVYNLQPVTDEDYVQANGLWEVLGRTPGQQDNLVRNVATHLFAAIPEVRKRTYVMFAKVNPDLGKKIEVLAEKIANDA
jgi:catalase